MKRLSAFALLLTAFCFSTPLLQAQNTPSAATDSTVLLMEGDTTDSELAHFLPESLDHDVDSLMQTWHVRYFSQRDTFCHDDDENPTLPDEVYQDRLMALPVVVPMTYNDVVQKCIDMYVGKRRSLMRYLLGMADHYFPIIEPILAREGIPLELKYLAVVESALNPMALSRSGASGLWQFILPTAKGYGLTVNSLIDERRDPVKSTEAACRYFKDMYAIYSDWHLVLASYNCGPGNVNKAIKRANGRTNFWDIYRFLPRETRLYVPLYIAATYAMTYHCDHNLCAVSTNIPLATDTLHIDQMLHFDQVVDMLRVDKELVRTLNPQYLRDIVPGNTGTAILRLPAAECYALAAGTDTLFQHRAEELLGTCIALNAPANTARKRSTQRITHTTKSGENLYTIANQYGVTARDIRRWNGLRTNRVYKGRRVVVYVDNGGVLHASTSTKKTGTKAMPPSPLSGSTYRVRSGDSLYTIAQRYPGVSAKDLQRANNLRSSSIRPGQILQIPKG